MEHLSYKVSALSAWKQALLREITRYRNLMSKGKLVTVAAEARLEAALHLLRKDQITLALIGEFSRGKTELINSLLYSASNQRLLPSQTGRTTLCPTELYFDPDAPHPCIQLLPIESRLSGKSLAVLRRKSKNWAEFPLSNTDPVALSKAFAEVASTKAMSKEDAERLGLCVEKLEPAEQPGLLLVPRWQHALINFDHPLLRMGLRIIDTPGLNALDSEPELTLSILPDSQAILFVLSLDTGVSATDLAVWRNDLRGHERGANGLHFAILNKIDLLWGDPQGEQFVQESINRMRSKTAEFLGIAVDDVFALSAKQGLLARMRGDSELLARSQLGSLEKLLGERLIRQKEQLLGQTVIKQVLELVQGSYQVLQQRLDETREQQKQLENQQQDSGQLLVGFANKTRAEHESYRKQLSQLKKSHNLLKEQSARMLANSPQVALKERIGQLRQEITRSLTTLGIRRASGKIFTQLENHLQTFAHEVRIVNQTVAHIYRQHNRDNPSNQAITAPLFELDPYREELTRLSALSHQFSLYPWGIFKAQFALKERFLTELEQKLIEFHQRLHENAATWGSSALVPLMQRCLEHKKLLENKMHELKKLTQDNHQAHKQGGELERHIGVMGRQLQELSEIIESLQQPLNS